MFINFLLRVFKENKNKDAIIWKDKVFSYKWILDSISEWTEKISSENIKQGTVVIIEADFSPSSVALFLASIQKGCILVPITSAVKAKKSEFIEIAQGEVSIVVDNDDNVNFFKVNNSANHETYNKLRELKHPGLVLFSSGSTGKSKAAVHDLMGILEKYKTPRHSLRTITFLLYDHIGGLNTMLYTLSNAGCIITIQNRTPDGVLHAVDKYKAELLPTSPTFLNLILLSEAYKKYNLDSLKTISYGTEPMPESTLKRLHEIFPRARLLQTYGLSEIGIMRSKSKSSDSLWVKVGGEGFETRIVDNILQIKGKSVMLGYLNSPSPFTEDGWFNTGDIVEVNGEYIKILGRKSEIINVGGQKVYPAEVESAIKEIDNIADVTVTGEKNPITGNIVCATIMVKEREDPKLLAARIRSHCSKRLERYKVPIKIKISEEEQVTERFKKLRK